VLVRYFSSRSLFREWCLFSDPNRTFCSRIVFLTQPKAVADLLVSVLLPCGAKAAAKAPILLPF
jgi:hypothetical protein